MALKLDHLREHPGKFSPLDPVSKKTLGTLEVRSINSASFKQAMVEAFKTNVETGVQPEEQDAKAIVSASLIVGWDDAFATEIGEPYSKEAALELSKTEGFEWFLTQLEVFVNTPSNFFTRP